MTLNASVVAATAAANGLTHTLRLVRNGPDRFTVVTTGGSLARNSLSALAVRACGATVDTNWRWVNSIQHTDLSAPEPLGGLDFAVERVCDTPVSAARLVRITQLGNPVAITMMAFDAPPAGRAPNLQSSVNPDDWVLPASLSANVIGGVVDLRPWPRPSVKCVEESSSMWMRTTYEVPDLLIDHVAALVFATVEVLERHAVAVTESGSPRRNPRQLSVRVHRGFRADDWLLCTVSDISYSNYRRLTVGQVHSSMGRLIASVAQESVDGAAVYAVNPARSDQRLR